MQIFYALNFPPTRVIHDVNQLWGIIFPVRDRNTKSNCHTISHVMSLIIPNVISLHYQWWQSFLTPFGVMKIDLPSFQMSRLYHVFSYQGDSFQYLCTVLKVRTIYYIRDQWLHVLCPHTSNLPCIALLSGFQSSRELWNPMNKTALCKCSLISSAWPVYTQNDHTARK